MAKIQLTATQTFDLRQVLHVASLEALMASRRWTPGDLVFQGGTSLHLAHGSPRLSEDLDFLVNSSLKLETIAESIKQRLQGSMRLPEGAGLTVSKAKDGHNPHSFIVAIGGPNIIGGVRVKLELWKTEKSVLEAVSAVVVPVQVVSGAGAGLQAFVPTAELAEIYADKVFALAARPYLKPRDVFDLHWLAKHDLKNVTAQDLRLRLATYPNETPQGWLDKAFARRAELRNAAPAIAKDLQRWLLPSSWPMNEAMAKQMAGSSVAALEQGIDMMRAVRDENDRGHDRSEPGL